MFWMHRQLVYLYLSVLQGNKAPIEMYCNKDSLFNNFLQFSKRPIHINVSSIFVSFFKHFVSGLVTLANFHLWTWTFILVLRNIWNSIASSQSIPWVMQKQLWHHPDTSNTCILKALFILYPPSNNASSPLKTLLISLWKVEGALFSPNGILTYSSCSEGYFFDNFISIWWNLLELLNVVKYWHLLSLFRADVMFEIGYLSSIILSLIFF